MGAASLAVPASPAVADAARLGASLAETDDPANYRALKQAVDHLLAAAGQQPDPRVCVERLLAVHDLVAPWLDARPHEPVLLFHAAVALAPLGEPRLVRALVDAAVSLEPRMATLPAGPSTPAAPLARLAEGRLDRLRDQLARAVERARTLPPPGRVSACLMVRDEEELLPGCLESIRAAVDEIIVVDTGSTDRTVEIAAGAGATVLHTPWRESFSAPRNYGLDHATGDWILMLDADERLDPHSRDALRLAARQTWYENRSVLMSILHGLLTRPVWATPGIPASGGIAPSTASGDASTRASASTRIRSAARRAASICGTSATWTSASSSAASTTGTCRCCWRSSRSGPTTPARSHTWRGRPADATPTRRSAIASTPCVSTTRATRPPSSEAPGSPAR